MTDDEDSSNNSNSSNNSTNENLKDTIQNLEFKVLSTFAKIPSFFQDVFSPSSSSTRRQHSLVDEHKEQINDLLLTEWERSTSFAITVEYNTVARPNDSLEMQVYKQSCSKEDRPAIWKVIFGIGEERNESAYQSLKQQWKCKETRGEFPLRFQEYISLIEKDVVRIEQTNPEYRVTNSKESLTGFDSGNEKINSIRNILITFLLYQDGIDGSSNVDNVLHGLGYSQGMTDICWSFFNLFSNESDAFWAFVGFMERHGDYFGKDSPSIKFDLLCLRKILELFYPQFYYFLQQCKALNMFFCYRWLVLFFKREFASIEEVYRVWEVLFTNPFSQKYQIFILLAIMDIYQDELQIFASEEGPEMEVITHFFSTKHFKLDQILERSEVLCKRYGMLESLLVDKDLKQLRQFRKVSVK